MVDNFNCPICNGQSWLQQQTYTYVKSSSHQSVNPTNERLNARRHVLFEFWFRGETTLQLHSICCKSCGFMCYSPRPTDSDLESKYRYLSSRKTAATANSAPTRVVALTDKRAKRVFNIITRHKRGRLSVLDYGGSDGRLLKYFVQAQHDCFLVDFDERPINGVIRIGAVAEDIPSNARFDAIICSHVLEHVSEPVGLLKKLHTLLNPGGILYAEVPLEIYREIPIRHDPVTHINFFTLDTLKAAAALSHLQVVSGKAALKPYDKEYKRVAWVVATKATEPTIPEKVKLDPSTTSKWLNPELATKTKRFVENQILRRALNRSLRS
jgi:SAM-dependent methyltransferase